MGENKRKQDFFNLSCIDIFSILCAAAVPIALGIYTAITYEQQQQQQKRAEELQFKQNIESRQDNLYNKFLKNVFKLDIDGYLEDDKNPWAFANAYYRAAHRHLEPVRKGDILQFLKEKQLIGRDNCSNGCRKEIKEDIIRLDELSFKNIRFFSQTGTLTKLNLDCIAFNRVLMDNTTFLNTNLNGASFNFSRLKKVNFHNSSLKCAVFDGTDLDDVDFTDTNLDGVIFINVDISKLRLTDEQWKQIIIMNKSTSNTITRKTETSKTTKLTRITSNTKAPIKTTTPSISTATYTHTSNGIATVSTAITSVSTAVTSISDGITTVSTAITSVSTTITTTPYCTQQLITFDDIPGATNTAGSIPDGYKNLKWINAEYLYVPETPTRNFFLGTYPDSLYVIRKSNSDPMEIKHVSGQTFTLTNFWLENSCNVFNNISIEVTKNSLSFILYLHTAGEYTYRTNLVFEHSAFVDMSSIIIQAHYNPVNAFHIANCTEIIIYDICGLF